MNEVGSPEPRVVKWIESLLPARGSVLEIGCGVGIYTGCMADVAATVDAVDAFEPYLVAARERSTLRGRSSVSYQLADASQWLPQQRGRRWDVAFAIDVIEHLQKDDAKRVIAELQRVADVVAIFTPEGWCPQIQDAWGFGGHYWQTHRSAWTAPELEILGFHVEVWDGFHPNADASGGPANALAAVWIREVPSAA